MARTDLPGLALVGLLGYLAWDWWTTRGMAAPPTAAPPAKPEKPTTPAQLPPSPAKVAWPAGDEATARARAQGFRPLSKATPEQMKRAWSFMPRWDIRSAFPDPTDPAILYVCARHGEKKGIEVWRR